MPEKQIRVPNPLLSPPMPIPDWDESTPAAEPRGAVAGASLTQDNEFLYHMAARSRASRIVTLKGNNRASFVGAFVAWLDSRWQTLVFESRHELMTAYLLLSKPGMENLWDQPPRVHYTDLDGKLRWHTFDFLVKVNGRRYAVACKFESSVRRLHFKSQLATIKSQWQDFADEVLLVTEQDYSREQALAAELFHFINREVDAEADEAVRSVTDALVGATTVQAIVHATGLKSRAWRSIVRHVGRRRLVVLGGSRIDDYTAHIARAAA